MLIKSIRKYTLFAKPRILGCLSQYTGIAETGCIHLSRFTNHHLNMACCTKTEAVASFYHELCLYNFSRARDYFFPYRHRVLDNKSFTINCIVLHPWRLPCTSCFYCCDSRPNVGLNVSFYSAHIASAVLATAIPSVRPSVCLSVRHTPVLCQNDGTYHDAVCTVG